MEIFLLVVITILAAYIVFLHIKLSKRDILLEKLIGKRPGLNISKEDSTLAEEKILDEKVLDFIFSDIPEARVYLHYTRRKEDAENILREGFRFADSFYKTAFQVTRDRLELIVKHNSKKYFGNFVVVICIAENIIKFYNDEILKAGVKNCHFENILTERPPDKNDNADTIYILPPKYVKGFLNYSTGEIFSNPGYNYNYTSPWFSINLNKLCSDY